MKSLLLALALLTPALGHAASDTVMRKLPNGIELTTVTIHGAQARKLFRVLAKAGFPTSAHRGIALLETSAINCQYHDPERDNHWVTENCYGGESTSMYEESARQIAPNIVNVDSFPNEKQVLAALPGGYQTADMGRGIQSWEKVDCEISRDLSKSRCDVTYRSDY